MVSIKTVYYKKRVKVLKDCIMSLIELLMIPKQDLMKYSLIDFQKLDKLLHGEFRGSIIFQNAFPKKVKK